MRKQWYKSCNNQTEKHYIGLVGVNASTLARAEFTIVLNEHN